MSATSHRPRLGALAALASALAAAAACPLPQPLPGVTRIDGGTITPPRIAVASALPSDTILYYDPAVCLVPGAAPFTLSASVVDQNTDEVVDVRWFVDYVAPYGTSPWQSELIAAPTEPDQFVRALESRTFNPARDTPDPNALHVVEVVVTNGGFVNEPLPNRSAAPGYEVEIFRWVFQPKASFDHCGDRPPP